MSNRVYKIVELEEPRVIRRMTLPDMSYLALKEVICERFSKAGYEASLGYFDEEDGSLIAFSSNVELEELKAERTGTLILTVKFSQPDMGGKSGNLSRISSTSSISVLNHSEVGSFIVAHKYRAPSLDHSVHAVDPLEAYDSCADTDSEEDDDDDSDEDYENVEGSSFIFPTPSGTNKTEVSPFSDDEAPQKAAIITLEDNYSEISENDKKDTASDIYEEFKRDLVSEIEMAEKYKEYTVSEMDQDDRQNTIFSVDEDDKKDVASQVDEDEKKDATSQAEPLPKVEILGAKRIHLERCVSVASQLSNLSSNDPPSLRLSGAESLPLRRAPRNLGDLVDLVQDLSLDATAILTSALETAKRELVGVLNEIETTGRVVRNEADAMRQEFVNVQEKRMEPQASSGPKEPVNEETDLEQLKIRYQELKTEMKKVKAAYRAAKKQAKRDNPKEEITTESTVAGEQETPVVDDKGKGPATSSTAPSVISTNDDMMKESIFGGFAYMPGSFDARAFDSPLMPSTSNPPCKSTPNLHFPGVRSPRRCHTWRSDKSKHYNHRRPYSTRQWSFFAPIPRTTDTPLWMNAQNATKPQQEPEQVSAKIEEAVLSRFSNLGFDVDDSKLVHTVFVVCEKMQGQEIEAIVGRVFEELEK